MRSGRSPARSTFRRQPGDHPRTALTTQSFPDRLKLLPDSRFLPARTDRVADLEQARGDGRCRPRPRAAPARSPMRPRRGKALDRDADPRQQRRREAGERRRRNRRVLAGVLGQIARDPPQKNRNHCSPARFPRLRSIMDSTVDNVKARGKSALLACFASRQEDYSDQVMLVPQVGFAVVDRVDCRSAGGHGLRLFCSRQRARGPSHSDRIKFRSSEAASRRLSECISTRNRSAACTVSPCSRPIWQPNKRTLAAEAEAARLAEVPGNSAGRFAKTWDHVDVAQQGVSGDPVVDQ